MLSGRPWQLRLLSTSSPSTGSAPIRWSGGNDLLRLYLQDIGRVDLLTAEEEVVLSRLVQQYERLKREERQLAGDHPAIARLLCWRNCNRGKPTISPTGPLDTNGQDPPSCRCKSSTRTSTEAMRLGQHSLPLTAENCSNVYVRDGRHGTG